VAPASRVAPANSRCATGWRPVAERGELDRWIIGELHRTIRAVRQCMDRFENYPAAGRINELVDALSNWYVRRSRERFWRPVAAGGSMAGETGCGPVPQRSGPPLITLKIDPQKIGKLIGPGGKCIKAIQSETGAQIDIEDDGTVFIACADPGRGQRAKELVQQIAEDTQAGQTDEIQVIKVKDYGVFIGHRTGYKPVPQDQDKWDAYNTLYEVLLALSQLIAPFTPFFAETMYQNLVRQQGNGATRQQGDETREHAGTEADSLALSSPSSLRALVPSCLPLSVHLCDYPEADPTLIDEALAQEMDLVRQIASLGRAARTEAKLKVRQPLAQVEIILARPEHTEWLAAHAELIADELNIKKVEFTSEADHYVSYRVKPDFKAIGPKFGPMAPKIAAALNKMDGAEARRALAATGELALSVEGQAVRLTDAEVQVRLQAKPGWSAAHGRAGVVVVKIELTPELKEEGLVRELIHRVQALRREQNLPYEARVVLYVQGPEPLLAVIRRFVATVQRECLAERIEFAAAPGRAMQAVKIESHEARLAIARL
jgi:hypothetical protein